jgi:biotin transport system substrate-specific component
MNRGSLRRESRNAAYIGLGAALLAVCAWVAIPMPIGVPFTLQTLGLCVAVGLLGGRRGTIAVAVYLLMGGLGLPVFAGFGGGFGVLTGATGGYLWGMLPAAAAMGGLLARYHRRAGDLRPPFGGYVGTFSLGAVIGYAVGAAWYVFLYARGTGARGIAVTVASCVLPYLVPDAVKILLAARICRRLCICTKNP